MHSRSQPGNHTPIYFGVMQHLDLSDEEAAALIKELADITGNDRYPFSQRIQTLRAILAKLRPEPAREPALPPKVYAASDRRQKTSRWSVANTHENKDVFQLSVHHITGRPSTNSLGGSRASRCGKPRAE
jgi:hypothetical protein